MKPFYNKRFFTIGGWFTWVAVGVAVVGATASAVNANQQKKKAAGIAGAASKEQESALKANVFRPPTMPQYLPFDFTQAQKEGIAEDRAFYARSDNDFNRRHAPVVQAEKMFEAGVLNDQKGERELMPQVQSELMRAGIGGALSSFGSAGLDGTLEPGGAGEASVARNLGLGVMDFQDRNRANREKSLSIAEDIFPRRTFGMSGADLVSNKVSDTQNQNAFNAAQYEREFNLEATRVGQQTQASNARIQSQNALATANAEAEGARNAAIIGAATSALSAGAKAYGGSQASVSGAVRPSYARYPTGGGTRGPWVPVGTYA